MLEATGITVRYGARAVLAQVDIAVRPGSVVAVIGPNGSGKSTLLSVLTGERPPDAGQALMDGTPLTQMSPRDLAGLRAVLEQTPARDVPYSAAVLATMGIPRELSPKGVQDAVDKALAQVGMQALSHTRVDQMSGGEAHRAHLGRALAQLWAAHGLGGGRYLFLDEPTASLDLKHQVAVLAAVRQAASEGAGVMVVLHDLSLAAAVADHIVLLSDGRVAAAGTPAEVMRPEVLQPVYGLDLHVVDIAGQLTIVPAVSAFEGRPLTSHARQEIEDVRRNEPI
ncbi:MAG: ATP-binding cassette domain-containing protein [Pseudomonadota bacterium]